MNKKWECYAVDENKVNELVKQISALVRFWREFWLIKVLPKKTI